MVCGVCVVRCVRDWSVWRCLAFVLPTLAGRAAASGARAEGWVGGCHVKRTQRKGVEGTAAQCGGGAAVYHGLCRGDLKNERGGGGLCC
jgi:hypothetical protein